tara:strand:- start:462 stop:803 length:342 start_codon:yes stop_codon:yes gene_type:complete
MSYASGKYAYFICDTCGFRYKYTKARMTWDNKKVCHECYEPKHPQLDPISITADAEALHQPRPDVTLPQSQLGLVKTTNASAGGMTFQSDPIGSKLEGLQTSGNVGSVTVSIT